MTTNPAIYKPTLMQKLLGRNYKWWFALKYNFNLSFSYLTSSIFVIVRDFLPLLISIIIYGTFLDVKEFVSYFIIANILLKTCSIVWDIAWDMRYDIKGGYISTKLLRPSNIIGQYFVVTFAANLFPLLINYFILLIILAVSGATIAISYDFFPALLLTLFGFLIYLSFDVIIGSLIFWLGETNTLIETKNILLPFLSGSLVLLNTNVFTQVFIYLPFSFAVYHPTQIYLGKYTSLETLYVFAGGIAWCVILCFLARWIFKMGLKRNEAVGL